MEFAVKPITDSQFKHLRDIVYSECGINLNETKKALMQARILRRMRFLRIDTYDEYIEYLNNNYDEEIIEFINVITTNKTEFFREDFHFDFMRATILPQFSGENEIRIWSAGCSTGEEPYSIAITAAEYFKNMEKPEVKILATDIDTNVIQTGKNGVYRYEQLESLSVPLLKKYFMKGSGENEGNFKAKDFLKSYIRFERLNLLDATFPMKKKFHFIFCRNVIIYFDKQTQIKLFRKFYDYLIPGGYLFLGHSENLSGSGLDFSSAGRTVYKKNM